MVLIRQLLTYFSFVWCISLFPVVASAGTAVADNDTVPAGDASPSGLIMESLVLYDFDRFPVSGITMTNPQIVTTHYEYDPDSGNFIKTQRIGDMVIGRPVYISFDEFLEYDMDRRLQHYWRERAEPQDFQRRDGLIPEIHIGSEFFDRIFGGSTIDIRPSGSAELIFGVMSNYREDPSLDEQRRRTTNFDFQQRIQLAIEADIGTKVTLGANYNTESAFDFDNRMKLEYRGTEDEILQLVEAGDVTLPLPGSLSGEPRAFLASKPKCCLATHG